MKGRAGLGGREAGKADQTGAGPSLEAVPTLTL